MNNQRIENIVYITGFEDDNKEGKSKEYSSRNSPNQNSNTNCKTLDYSNSKKSKKVISIVFPTIQIDTKIKNSKFSSSSSQKYMKLYKNSNKDEKIYKSHKNMMNPISKIKNYSKFDKRNIFKNDSRDNINYNNINYYIYIN